MSDSVMTVFHAKRPSWGAEDRPFVEDEYDLVALVDGDDLSWAFQLTNHIDHPWWDNDGVIVVGEKNRRSTSVGDVVMLKGVAHRCTSFGWEPVATSTVEG